MSGPVPPLSKGDSIEDRLAGVTQQRDELSKQFSTAMTQNLKLREEMKDAWQIINVLTMTQLDDNEKSWPRALEWLKRNGHLRPEGQNGPALQPGGAEEGAK